ncbi:MAG: metallophosphoesterase [Planctomycetes bacterium]|nr:metallophosphoesterase [Planctomycetota bacterium]
MLAFVSDLHANLEALTCVLDDIKQQGISEIVCLGDLVGYGPNPAEVVDIAMGFSLTLMGNHDEAVINEALGFNPVARQAIEWTRKQLKPGLFSASAKKGRWEFLKALPRTHQRDDLLFVHGSPRDPTMEYILPSDCEDLLGGVPPKIQEIFSKFDRLCFVGHTHLPGVISEESVFIRPEVLGYRFEIPPGKKFIINVSSVGQPRDRDPRACYATFDGKTVTWRRIEYPHATTRDKILAIPELGAKSANRLALGE